MIFGLCCGPVGIVLFYIGNSFVGSLKLGMAALLSMLAWAFIFGCLVLKGLPAAASWKDRLFAIFGVFAPFGWVLAILAFFAVPV